MEIDSMNKSMWSQISSLKTAHPAAVPVLARYNGPFSDANDVPRSPCELFIVCLLARPGLRNPQLYC